MSKGNPAEHFLTDAAQADQTIVPAAIAVRGTCCSADNSLRVVQDRQRCCAKLPDNDIAPSGAHRTREGSVRFCQQRADKVARLGDTTNVRELPLNLVIKDKPKLLHRLGPKGAWPVVAVAVSDTLTEGHRGKGGVYLTHVV